MSPLADAAETPTTSTGRPVLTIIYALFATAATLILWKRGWLRFPREPEPGRPGLPASSAIVLAFGMFILHGFTAELARITIQPAPGGREEAFTLMAGGLVGYFIVFAVYALLRQKDRQAGREAPGRPLLDSAAGVFSFFLWFPLVQTAAFVITVLVVAISGRTPEAVAHTLLLMLTGTPPDVWFWAIIICVCTLTPLFEELLYRGLLQDGLVRLGLPRWGAIASASAVFALVHWQAATLPALAGLFVLALGLGWVYERTGGRLAAPVAMHAMFNLANLLLTFAAVRGG